MTGTFTGRWHRSVTRRQFPFTLAYAITVHKSQGSDFETVFLVLPQAAGTMSRELLYTAIRFLPWVEPRLACAPEAAAQIDGGVRFAEEAHRAGHPL